jgi:hypothetical protein
MNQKGYVHLEVEKGDKLFFFAMPMGASLAEATDAALLVLRECDRLYREAMDKQLKEEEPKSSE